MSGSRTQVFRRPLRSTIRVEALLGRPNIAGERIGELTAQGSEADLVMFRSFEPGPGSTRFGLLLNEEAIRFLHKAGAGVWIEEYDDE